MTRARLPHRRAHETFDFIFSRGPHDPGHEYTCGYHVAADGQLSEIFIDCHKLASSLTDDARDLAVVLSIALQHGAPISTIRHAVSRIEDGEPVGLAGRVLDELAKREPEAFGERSLAAPGAAEIKVPCPHCADGFVDEGDRHARTAKDVCSTCGGTHQVPANTGQMPEASFDPASMLETVEVAAGDRDDRQAQMRRWILRIWGEDALHPHERVERLLEEVIELAQAEHLPAERIAGIVTHVFGKEPGEAAQEIGGISTCLLAYCASRSLSADTCERAELTRILGKTVEHFRARHQAKVDAGMARSFAPTADGGAAA